MKIGIVTISFNQGRYLTEAISSVALSGRHSLEYVIVDPGSRDDSLNIISKNKYRFSKIILEPDEGPADGLNKGFAALTHAEICGYLNADDRFSAGALDFVAEHFETHPETDILLGSVLILDGEGRIALRGRRVNRITPRRFAAGISPVWQQATFFRRSAFDCVGGFNPANRISWDAELVVDMILARARVSYTSTVLGEFRIYPTSITGSLRAKHLDAHLRQEQLIREKIWAAGHPKLPEPLSKVVQALNKINPIRHAQNLAIGLAGRSARRTA